MPWRQSAGLTTVPKNVSDKKKISEYNKMI